MRTRLARMEFLARCASSFGSVPRALQTFAEECATAEVEERPYRFAAIGRDKIWITRDCCIEIPAHGQSLAWLRALVWECPAPETVIGPMSACADGTLVPGALAFQDPRAFRRVVQKLRCATLDMRDIPSRWIAKTRDIMHDLMLHDDVERVLIEEPSGAGMVAREIACDGAWARAIDVRAIPYRASDGNTLRVCASDYGDVERSAGAPSASEFIVPRDDAFPWDVSGRALARASDTTREYIGQLEDALGDCIDRRVLTEALRTIGSPPGSCRSPRESSSPICLGAPAASLSTAPPPPLGVAGGGISADRAMREFFIAIVERRVISSSATGEDEEIICEKNDFRSKYRVFALSIGCTEPTRDNSPSDYYINQFAVTRARGTIGFTLRDMRRWLERRGWIAYDDK